MKFFISRGREQCETTEYMLIGLVPFEKMEKRLQEMSCYYLI